MLLPCMHQPAPSYKIFTPMVTMMRKMRRKESLAEMMFRFATRRLINCHCHRFTNLNMAI